MGSSPARVYSTAKPSPAENFKHGLTNYMVVNMATNFGRGILCMLGFLGTLETLDKKLDL